MHPRKPTTACERSNGAQHGPLINRLAREDRFEAFWTEIFRPEERT
jgi:hypothetical protein